MLTDLSFLERGQKWPPECEKPRLEDYDAHKRLFENEHSEIYRRQMRRIERVVGNFSDIVSFPIIFNYQRLMALKVADLVFGEPPSITIADTDGAGSDKQKIIDKILMDTGLLDTAYMAAIDVSRYGDGLMIASKRGEKLIVDITSPAVWYPVVDKANIKRILYHVLAFCYLADKDKKQYNLRIQIHDPEFPGKCQDRTFILNGQPDNFTIGREVEGENPEVETELDMCPLFRVPNILTSDRIFGLDDYTSIDSIVSELIIRVSQISRVLDVHANPSMSGPASALMIDPVTNEYRLQVGDFFVQNDKDDPAPKYLVWDASLDANFKQIELLINQLYTVSEMGAALFGDISNTAGQVASGSALRRLMVAPLAKARRIANKFDPVLKRIISLCASLEGSEILPEEISISWNDGLPDDEAELANIMAVRTGGQPTISQYSAIQRLDRLSAEDTESELEEMRTESASRAPAVMGIVDGAGDNGEENVE